MKSEKTLIGILDFSLVTFIVLLILMTFLWGCKHEPLDPGPVASNGTAGGGGTGGGGTGGGGTGGGTSIPCDPDTVYFQNVILPLFVSNCAKSGCHNAATHEEGFVFNSFNGIMASGEIEPGDPSDGDIMEVIMESDPDKIMPPPPNTPLTQQQVSLIAQWISQGAKNNSCSGECDTTNVTFGGTIAPLLQAKCTGCHNGTTTSGGINLTVYAGVEQAAMSGRLLGAVNHQMGYTPMPQGGPKLPQCEIDQIRIWIDNGALNN